MELNLVNKKAQPEVCICNIDVTITPKKWLHMVNHERESVRKDAVNKYVSKISLKNFCLTLLDGKFPTVKTEERLLKSIWRASNSKDKFEDLSLKIIKLDIKCSSPINYEFDYEKH